MAKNSLTGKGGGPTGLGPASGQNTAQGGGGGGVVVETWNRNVSYYKLTASDVILLGGLGFLSTLFFSLGFAALGFYANIKTGVAFSSGPLSPEGELFKDTFMPLFFYSGIVLVIVGVAFTLGSVVRFHYIKKEHTKSNVAF